MKAHDLNSLDQADALALRSRLQLHAANLRGLLHTAEGQFVSPPALTADGDALADIPKLEAHITELEAKLGGTAPSFSEAAPASKPSKAPAFPPFADTGKGGKKMTLTEKVLAAKGAKSLAELSEREAMRPTDIND
jgi:hypothetical protein